MAHTRGEEQLTSPVNTTRVVGRSLRKQKSLPRLLSSSSWRNARPRTPSLDEPPPTPVIPDHFLSSSPTLPGSPLYSQNNSPVDFQVPVSPEEVNLNRAKAEEHNRPEPTAKPTSRRIFSSHTSRTGTSEAGMNTTIARSCLDQSEIPRATSIGHTRKAEKPKIIQHSPTFHVLPNQSQEEVQTPITFRPISRDREASTSSHKTYGPNQKAKAALRPSTAVGDRSFKQGGDLLRGKGFKFANNLEEEPVSTNKSQRSVSDSRTPLQGLSDHEEVRASFRSALTSSSSILDIGSTERSSVMTKDSSISDLTPDVLERPGSKSGSMTVDDAIGMYSTGFADDTDSEYDEKQAPSSEEDRRRSIKIAEAMSDTIDSNSLSPMPPSSPGLRSSTSIMSGDAFRSSSPQPPCILPPTSKHDQYGFRKTSHNISTTQHDAWSIEYTPIQERRILKWISYMRDHSLSTYHPLRFPDRSAKAQRFIRKGIPPVWRGAAWFFYAGGDALLRDHPDAYSTLVSRSRTSELGDNDKEIIERDLHRTFPDNIHFKPDSPINTPSSIPSLESPLLSSLRRVLRAFALHNPRIGYCQSLNFLTGLLLLFLSEEKSFWMLHIITTKYLPGTHEVSLEGANVDLWVLMTALKESMPGIWTKVGGESGGDVGIQSATRLPPISLCTTSWFMSLFIGTLPVESVLRVWDVLFYEGSRTLFRVALAIFKIGEQRIKDVNDPMEIFQVVQALPRGMLNVATLMEVSCRRNGVSQEWVERRRKERKGWYAGEREKMQEATETTGGETCARGGRDRASSGWRRRVGLGR
ncbi:hypothetical protein MMC12_004733 [Toensbergia leucococca]|nr:hypothetical protein [Toensbergia leucococca]